MVIIDLSILLDRITVNGLTRYLLSDDNLLMMPNRVEMYEDMTQPLSHYFINSSHNTYLVGKSIPGIISGQTLRKLRITLEMSALFYVQGGNVTLINLFHAKLIFNVSLPHWHGSKVLIETNLSFVLFTVIWFMFEIILTLTLSTPKFPIYFKYGLKVHLITGFVNVVMILRIHIF